MSMKQSRRSFLQTAGAAGVAAAFGKTHAAALSNSDQGARNFHFVQTDVFTSHRLEGNPLAVFTDARGLSDSEMAGLSRETNLQETTFIFPRDAATEREHGVKVRIFIPGEEIPFGGHPTLGTSMVLRNLRLAAQKSDPSASSDLDRISLDLQVGKIPVEFRTDASGNIFGEMHQVDPIFGPVHDRDTIAALLDLSPSDISSDGPIQTLSTGLYFVLVPIKNLSTLQRLTVAPQKAYDYLRRQKLPDTWRFLLLHARHGRSRDRFALKRALRRRHRRRSRNRFCLRMHSGMDGAVRNREAGGDRSHPARRGDQASQPHFRACQ